MTLRLFVIRHGETEWSLSGQYTGRADVKLTENGKAEARKIEDRIRDIEFAHVMVSPLERARQTCQLAGLGKRARVDVDLIEWDNGDYEGQTPNEVRANRPDWNMFRDGCPNGEHPDQIASRVDRLIASLKKLTGNVVLFTHGHLGRVLGARWIGLSIEHAQHFCLDTGSISILSYEPEQQEQTLSLWNSSPKELSSCAPKQSSLAHVQADVVVTKREAIEQWENEGGEVLRKVGAAPPAADPLAQSSL
ncbi:MAG: histidine phosphatase family protein [Pirellulaceae bacterium]|nr:histidine phosphatase family protein [Pirellulaceae bacterium]